MTDDEYIREVVEKHLVAIEIVFQGAHAARLVRLKESLGIGHAEIAARALSELETRLGLARPNEH